MEHHHLISHENDVKYCPGRITSFILLGYNRLTTNLSTELHSPLAECCSCLLHWSTFSYHSPWQSGFFCIASSNELAASTWLIKQAYIFPLIDLLQEEIPFNVLTEPWPRSHLPCIIYTLLAFQFLSSVICISIPPPPERRLHLIGYLHNYFEKESIKKITNRRSE